MLLDQRREQILYFIERKGFASLQDLMDDIGVSESTIRRDLEYLDGIGQIRRTRGGAAYVGESLTPFDDRTTRSLSEKQRIGRAVAEMIESGESVLLGGGTTTLEVARHLTGKELQVVTNSLPIANLLVNSNGIELIFLGGYMYPKTGVALGPMVLEALSRIHVRKLIISTGGITDGGLFNSNSLLVEAERQMLKSAEETVVVVDSGKLGHAELAYLCDLDQVDQIVVDDGITETWKQKFSDAGIKTNIVK